MTRSGASVSTLAIAAALLVAAPPHAHGAATLWLGGGATGSTTPEHPFQGGWGAGLSLEVPAFTSASFLARVDGDVVPAFPVEIYDPIVRASSVGSLFGHWPAGADRLTMTSAMAGQTLMFWKVVR